MKEADLPDDKRRNRDDRRIGPDRAQPRPPAALHEANRKPLVKQEQIGRANREQDQRITVEAVKETLPWRLLPIFARR